MKGKRGWIRILEATIAVLIVSATMLAVYSDQDRGSEQLTVSDYSYSLQKQILADIVISSDLRLEVLSVDEDVAGDAAYDNLKIFVDSKIPDSFGYLLRICDLGEICNMDSNTFIATLDNDVFVEEVVISSELGVGSDAVYSPRKVRLFFWEGGFPAGYCVDVCSENVLSCYSSTELLNRSCVVGGDGCLELDEGVVEPCTGGEVCSEGECVEMDGGLYSQLVCVDNAISSFSSLICAEGNGDANLVCLAISSSYDRFYHWGDADNNPALPDASVFSAFGYDSSTHPWYCGTRTGPVDTNLFSCIEYGADATLSSCNSNPDCPLGKWEKQTSECSELCDNDCSYEVILNYCDDGDAILAECASDHDSDSCYEWENVTTICSSGCSNGICD